MTATADYASILVAPGYIVTEVPKYVICRKYVLCKAADFRA